MVLKIPNSPPLFSYVCDLFLRDMLEYRSGMLYLWLGDKKANNSQ